MSPRRRAPREPRALVHARGLLEGRLPAGAAELLEAIHEVNPTGRALEPADERRRYDLKARLQSLLIGKLHDELVIRSATCSDTCPTPRTSGRGWSRAAAR